jgi:hypothetical protein
VPDGPGRHPVISTDSSVNFMCWVGALSLGLDVGRIDLTVTAGGGAASTEGSRPTVTGQTCRDSRVSSIPLHLFVGEILSAGLMDEPMP